MKRLSPCIAWIAAVLLMSAAIPANSQANGGDNGNATCKFDTSGTTGLSFGPLDPSQAIPVVVTGTVSVGDCSKGKTMVLTIDQGQRGNLTMLRDGGSELISYSVSTPNFSNGTASTGGPGNSAYLTATFTGTVQATAYIDAMAGTYRDQLIVTVTP